jgi:hypothetical protein
MHRAGVQQLAMLAARRPSQAWPDCLCRRHLGDLLAEVPDSSLAGIVASVLEAAAAALAGGGEIPGCSVCSRQDDVARRQRSGLLCLHHLRRLARCLTWDALRGNATRLLDALGEQCTGDELHAPLWGSDRLTGIDDGDDACSICTARAGARIRQFEWLADAVHRFPTQAGGAAAALCGPHAWSLSTFSPGSGLTLADLASQEWSRRLAWLLAGLQRRPPDRLAARLAALPATLASLADDEGRLHIAVILRATAAAALRTPGAVLARLTATALGTEACPVCAAEEHDALTAAAAGGAVVCASDLGLVRSVNRDRAAVHALRFAAIRRLEREAGAVRDGVGAVDCAISLAPVRHPRY